MSRLLERKLLLAVAVCAVLAGVGAAVVMAAQPGSSAPPAARHRHRHAASAGGGGLLAIATSYLGVSREQLRTDLRSGKSLADIANATPGKSAEGLIQALEVPAKTKLATRTTALHDRIAAEVNTQGLPGLVPEHARRPGLQATAAEYLGISRSQLRGDLRSGHSLAQVASSTSGRSEAGLIQALVAARQARVSAEVAAGTITQAQGEALLAKLTQRMSARVKAGRAGR